jgi:phospholipase/carboxylesterase
VTTIGAAPVSMPAQADHATKVADVRVWRSAPTRRGFLAACARLAVAGVLTGCSIRQSGREPGGRGRAQAALTARPGEPTEPWPGPGTHQLGLEADRDCLLHVPPGLLRAGQSVPLVVTLHGAGGDAAGGLALLQSLADERGLLLLAPASKGMTWDAIRGGYGPDVDLIDRALRQVFSAVPVDGERIAVAGFSDGASYALGLGLANGGLWDGVVAFSPGFVPEAPRAGAPRIFVSHGTADDLLPIGRTSRKIVPALRDEGLDVTYREFAGPHTVPPEIAREAVDWLGWHPPG